MKQKTYNKIITTETTTKYMQLQYIYFVYKLCVRYDVKRIKTKSNEI